jgi:5,10-methylenetetrahydromethanopterin reductase
MTAAEARGQPPLTIGIRVPSCASLDALVDHARRAERAGIDAIWLPDSQLMWRDVFAAAALIGSATQRVTIGTLVTNVVTRHPSVVASASATAQEVSGGRFVLGLGRGGTAVGSIGASPTPLAEFEARVDELRTLMGEGSPEAAGPSLAYAAPSAPIHIGVNGPKASALAGRIGDGVVIFGGADVDLISSQLTTVGVGRRTSQRSAEPFQATSITWGRVTDDPERDARLVKPLCVFFAQTAGPGFLAQLGVEMTSPVESLPDVLHFEDWDVAVDVADPFVSDAAAFQFARRYCLFGSLTDIEVRLGTLAAAGLTGMCIRHFGNFGLPEELLEPFGALATATTTRGAP